MDVFVRVLPRWCSRCRGSSSPKCSGAFRNLESLGRKSSTAHAILLAEKLAEKNLRKLGRQNRMVPLGVRIISVYLKIRAPFPSAFPSTVHPLVLVSHPTMNPESWGSFADCRDRNGTKTTGMERRDPGQVPRASNKVHEGYSAEISWQLLKTAWFSYYLQFPVVENASLSR